MSNELGSYELRGELGRGAMAVVWRAFDPSVGREVAIKEPKIDDSLDPATRDELVSRFIREGRTAGQLNHPGIVTIYNAEVIAGRPIIAMELIEGETLADVLRRSGRLPLAAAVGIAEQLLDALAYAHSRGVVHRDIKPDNVFVTDDGRVKLTDFGIAHVGAGTQLTQAGTVMGTPGYMAPEQVRGEAVDARADIFAVGVMLHEMLCGENPFVAGDAHPTTIMYRVLNEPLPDVRTILPDATEGLAATVALATAKDAVDRFASAEEMRRALLGEVAVAMPKAPKAQSVRGKGTIAVAAALVTLVAAGVLAWVFWPGGSNVERPAVGAVANAGTGDAAEATAPRYALAFYRDDSLRTVDPGAASPEPRVYTVAGRVPLVREPVWDQESQSVVFAEDLINEMPNSVWAIPENGQAHQILKLDGSIGWEIMSLTPGATGDGPSVRISGDDAITSYELNTDGSVGTQVDVASPEAWEYAVSPDGSRAMYTVWDDEREIPVTYFGSSDGSDQRALEDEFTGFAGDFGSYSWLPDGSGLVSVFDGYTETGAMSSIPSIVRLSDSGEITRTLFEYDGDSEGAVIDRPVVSPDGKMVAFAVEGTLWVVGIDGVNAHEIGDGSRPVWVPYSWYEASE